MAIPGPNGLVVAAGLGVRSSPVPEFKCPDEDVLAVD